MTFTITDIIQITTWTLVVSNQESKAITQFFDTVFPRQLLFFKSKYVKNQLCSFINWIVDVKTIKEGKKVSKNQFKRYFIKKIWPIVLSTRTIRLHFHTIFVAVPEAKQPCSTQILSGYAYHKDFHAGLNMYIIFQILMTYYYLLRFWMDHYFQRFILAHVLFYSKEYLDVWVIV